MTYKLFTLTLDRLKTKDYDNAIKAVRLLIKAVIRSSDEDFRNCRENEQINLIDTLIGTWWYLHDNAQTAQEKETLYLLSTLYTPDEFVDAGAFKVYFQWTEAKLLSLT